MFDPEKHHIRELTHQLYALNILRERGFAEENDSALIDRLCERIASEAMLDFRVTDLYLQRVAFILHAGRPDLIKRRWVERILANQAENGGFTYAWHGCGPGMFKFFDSRPPIDHATVQGVWLLYMLNHRYPDWVEQNYPD